MFKLTLIALGILIISALIASASFADGMRIWSVGSTYQTTGIFCKETTNVPNILIDAIDASIAKTSAKVFLEHVTSTYSGCGPIAGKFMRYDGVIPNSKVFVAPHGLFAFIQWYDIESEITLYSYTDINHINPDELPLK